MLESKIDNRCRAGTQPSWFKHLMGLLATLRKGLPNWWKLRSPVKAEVPQGASMRISDQEITAAHRDFLEQWGWIENFSVLELGSRKAWTLSAYLHENAPRTRKALVHDQSCTCHVLNFGWVVNDRNPQKRSPELVTDVKTTNPACSLLQGASSNKRVENSMQGGKQIRYMGSNQPLRGGLWPFPYHLSTTQPACQSVSDHHISVGCKYV